MNRHETVAAGIEAAAHGALLDKETRSCNGRLRRTGPLEVAKAPGRQTVTSALIPRCAPRGSAVTRTGRHAGRTSVPRMPRTRRFRRAARMCWAELESESLDKVMERDDVSGWKLP